jgi:hypothetical protein
MRFIRHEGFLGQGAMFQPIEQRAAEPAEHP